MVSCARSEDHKLDRPPTLHDVDLASSEHPISISRSSGHIIVVNSYVLQVSGIGKDSKDPAGGSSDRDSDGTPKGVIRESSRKVLKRRTRST